MPGFPRFSVQNSARPSREVLEERQLPCVLLLFGPPAEGHQNALFLVRQFDDPLAARHGDLLDLVQGGYARGYQGECELLLVRPQLVINPPGPRPVTVDGVATLARCLLSDGE